MRSTGGRLWTCASVLFATAMMVLAPTVQASAAQAYYITGIAGFSLGWPMGTQPTRGMERTDRICPDSMHSLGVGTVMWSEGYTRDIWDPWGVTVSPVTLGVFSFRGMVGSVILMWWPGAFARADDPESAWRNTTARLMERLLAGYNRSLIVQQRTADDGTAFLRLRDAQGNELSLLAERRSPDQFEISVVYFWVTALRAAQH